MLFVQAEDGIRFICVTGVLMCAIPFCCLYMYLSLVFFVRTTHCDLLFVSWVLAMGFSPSISSIGWWIRYYTHRDLYARSFPLAALHWYGILLLYAFFPLAAYPYVRLYALLLYRSVLICAICAQNKCRHIYFLYTCIYYTHASLLYILKFAVTFF